jgi:maltokinase
MPLDRAVSHAVSGLCRPLTRAGAFLRGFHEELAARLGPGEPFPAEAFLAAAGRRIDEVASMIRADGRHPAAAGAAVLAALRSEWSRGKAACRGDWPGGPSHGDLHLSHFLRAEGADGGWQMCLIDLSTPPLDPSDPRHAAQSPWQDPMALLRGLACFTGDEFAFQAGLDLGIDKSDTCRTAYLRSAGLAPDTPGWTAPRLVRLDRLSAAAAAWQERVGGLLMRGYAPDGATREHPAWRALGLSRLLHDLSYAYTHDRPYYAAVTLRQALQIGTAERSGS